MAKDKTKKLVKFPFWGIQYCQNRHVLFYTYPAREKDSSCMTDSATQSASPPVKNYHMGLKLFIPIGCRFEPKPSFFLGWHERRIVFESIIILRLL